MSKDDSDDTKQVKEDNQENFTDEEILVDNKKARSFQLDYLKQQRKKRKTKKENHNRKEAHKYKRDSSNEPISRLNSDDTAGICSNKKKRSNGENETSIQSKSFELVKNMYEDLKQANINAQTANTNAQTANNELIQNLRSKITELNTELAYRDGLLNCRGVIEKTESQFCYSSFTYQNSSRKDKWSYILNKEKSLLKDIQSCTNISYTDTLADHITNLYKELSNKIHNTDFGPKAIKICGNISTDDAQILACICKCINIKWESDLIDENMKVIRKRVDLNRSFVMPNFK